jgi:ATP-dependent DNA helicase RecQ
VLLRQAPEAPTRRGAKGRRAKAGARGGSDRAGAEGLLDAAAQQRYAELKRWRAEVAREHSLPPYIVFHDATLAEMARLQPGNLAELGEVSGVGAKKLEAYGSEILRVLAAGG